MARAYRTVVSRPDPDVEARASGSGPVKTRKMSPEEMEDHFARTAHKNTPVQMSKSEEANELRNLESKKQEIIEMIADGCTYKKVEESLGLKKNTFRYYLGKLGLEGLDKVKALQLLGKISPQPEDTALQNKTLKEYERKLAEWQHLEKELQQLKLENMNLKKDLEESKALQSASSVELRRLKDHCVDLEQQVTQWQSEDNETQSLLLEVMAERDQLEKRVNEFKVLLDEMTEDRDNWQQTAREAKQALIELQEEYQSQPSEIAVAVPFIQPDMVNHPSHYTHGGIETIDFIRAKLSPDEFVGYCKGNVIKYMARANYKGGFEDLRKAGKYIEFATKEA